MMHDALIVNTPRTLDVAWIKILFPNKSDMKINTWLAVLNENEFEDEDDLAALDEAGWNSMQLPLAVKSTLRQYVQRKAVDIDMVSPTATKSDTTTETELMNAPPLSPPPPPPRSLPPITQVDVIVMDISVSMRARSHFDADMSREDMSKVLFHTMMDKMMGLELSHVVGLIAFGETVTPISEISREYEKFHDELGRLDAAQRATKLYDAIFEAARMLETYNTQRRSGEMPIIESVGDGGPETIASRIFVLTDGADNASKHAPWEVAQYLQQHGIVLDAIPIVRADKNLAALARASGGLCLNLVSLEQGIRLFEREALLAVSNRSSGGEGADAAQQDPPTPPITDTASFLALANSLSATSSGYGVGGGAGKVNDIVSAQPSGVMSSVLAPSSVAAKAAAEIARHTGGVIASSGNGGNDGGSGPGGQKGIRSGGAAAATIKRVMKEYHDFIKQKQDGGGCEGLSAFVNEDNLKQWKVVMQGPDGTPYEGGHWLLTVRFPDTYPFQPMRVQFVTPVYHCNINNDGHICLGILKDDWNPALTIFKVLNAVRLLLEHPNPSDPLDAFKAQVYNDDRAAYDRAARDATHEHASGGVDSLMARYNLI